MIEALVGLVGVVVGSVITISKEVWTSWFERRRNGSFAAVRIVGVLDQFIETCVDVVTDDGTAYGQYAGRSDNGEEYAVAQVSCPTELSFPDDIDWRSIGNAMMYRVLMLPSKVKQANRYIAASGDHAFPPDYDEFFEARHESYAELGVEALEIASELRQKFGIPDQLLPKWNPDWDARKFFLDKKQSIEDVTAKRAASSSKLFEEMENE